MSSFLAISGVSSTLRNILRDRMEQTVPITIAPPDAQVDGIAGRRLNIYLYQVTENGSLKNQEIPGQGHPAAYGCPPLSLDLHYLLTPFGASETAPDADLEAQQILGDAMRVLHGFSIITEDLHENGNVSDPRILDPSLVGAFENIKITLQPTSLEAFADIWTALPQANFRLSVAYQVSVVQIESRRRRRSALPVRERRVYAFPLRSPHITEIVRNPPFEGVRMAVAEVGDTILILGRNLAAEGTRANLGETSVPVPSPQDTRISLTVPVTLPAGVHPVQVVQDLFLEGGPGQPFVPHRGFESNVAPLVVIPRITAINPASGGAGTVVTVTVDPPVLAKQQKTLVLGDVEVPAEPVPIDAAPSTNIQFRLPTGAAAIPAATYLVRVRVDGAESRLTSDAATNEYDGPTFTAT